MDGKYSMQQKKLKVLFVRAPVVSDAWPPIGLPYLATFLRQKGYSVEIDDINIKMNRFRNSHYLDKIQSFEWQKVFFEENKKYFDDWVQSIIDSHIDVLGFMVWATNKYVSEWLTALVKKKNSKIKILYGGPSSTDDFRLVERRDVDAIVWGEGEETVLEVLDNWEENKDIENVAGITFSGKDYLVRTNPRRKQIENLDALPFVDLSYIELGNYYEDAIPLMFSRGCSWQCKFCRDFTYWQKYRTRSADNIFNEILLRLKEYKRERYDFQLYDCAFNQNIKMLNELCDKIISLKLPENSINFGGFAKVMPEDVDFDFLKKMRRAGFKSWSLGVESGCDRVLRLMGKPFKAARAEEILRYASELGIEQTITIIAGFPGETEEDWDETINFVERISGYLHNLCLNHMWLSPELVQLRFSDSVGPDFEDKDGLKWTSLDGTSTYEIRLKRLERLDKRMENSPYLKKIEPLHYVRLQINK